MGTDRPVQVRTVADDHENQARHSAEAASPKADTARRDRGAHLFTHWERRDQLRAFFQWLPQELHDAPGIDWTQLPPEIMGYCVKTIRTSPDAPILALAAASAHGALTMRSHFHFLSQLNRFLQALRAKGNMHQLADLHREQVWYDWATSRARAEGARQQLKTYTTFVTRHFPSYLLRLRAADRSRMQQYALPPAPPDLVQQYFPNQSLKAVRQARRRAQSDVLVPLYPVLRQLVRFRKQLVERTVLAIREARRKVETGEAVLPFHFEHLDTFPEVNRDARTVAEVQIVGREVRMSFILWDKATWILHHKERYSEEPIKNAKGEKGSYAQERNTLFVQFEGPASDLFWFGDLIEHRVLKSFHTGDHGGEEYQQRWRFARQLGFTNGCYCDRPGLLSPRTRWFSFTVDRGTELVFEPEALYRGVVYGAALAMLALSNGSRVSELLQVSWNKERRVTRTETVVVLGQDGQPLLGEDGKPLTKQVKIHLQSLLPKGAKTQEERQLFPLSRESLRLLAEIKSLLEEVHGEIPVVHPSRSSSKYEHLQPERYLFQWAATPDGRGGILHVGDVEVLLRFILHGLDLYTMQGAPIRVSVHLLRHVMATHARQYRHVPPEVIAHFFLHHRLKELTGHDPPVPKISDYYFMMTEEQRLAVIRADLDEQEELDRALLQAMPSSRDLAQKNADLQAVYDEWHTLHPTAFGNCGCPGLCPRGTDRSLCLGCSYHVEDPDKLGAALAWRAGYVRQAALLETQGNAIDARQARIKVQQLDDMINVMRMQLQLEAEGSYIPLHKVLPSPLRNAEEKQ